MGLTANRDGLGQIVFLERVNRAKHGIPSRFPLRDQMRSRILRFNDEFPVTIPAGLVPVCRQEISPSRQQVPRQMFDHNGHRVYLLGGLAKETFLIQRAYRSISQTLVAAEFVPDVRKKACHSLAHRRASGSLPTEKRI